MIAFQRWFTLMMAQWLVLWPWLFVGVGLSTAALLLTSRPWWKKILPKSSWGQLLGGLGLGLVLPLAQVGALPLMRRLLWQTGSTSGAIAFWLGTISINPFFLVPLWQQSPGQGGLILVYGALSLSLGCFIAGIFAFEHRQRTYDQGDLEPFSYPVIARPSSHRLSNPQAESLPTVNKLTILPTSRRFRSLTASQNLTQELLEWSGWLAIACGVMALGQLLFPLRTLLEHGIIGLLGAGIFYGLQPGQMASLFELLFANYGGAIALGFLLTGTFFNGITLVFLINTVRWRAYVYLCLLLGLAVLLLDIWLNFYVF